MKIGLRVYFFQSKGISPLYIFTTCKNLILAAGSSVWDLSLLTRLTFCRSTDLYEIWKVLHLQLGSGWESFADYAERWDWKWAGDNAGYSAR